MRHAAVCGGAPPFKHLRALLPFPAHSLNYNADQSSVQPARPHQTALPTFLQRIVVVSGMLHATCTSVGYDKTSLSSTHLVVLTALMISCAPAMEGACRRCNSTASCGMLSTRVLHTLNTPNRMLVATTNTHTLS